MVTVDNPRLGVVQEFGQYSCSVHADLGVFLQMPVTPHSLAKSPDSSACFCQSAVNFLV